MIGKLRAGHGVCVRALLTFTMLLAWGHGAVAEPLDESACQRLRTEQKALSVLGIDKYFEQGADWVKANLTSADHNLVKRYVNVFEQLKFRCPEGNVAKAKAKVRPVARGRVPPLPTRSPSRIESTEIPVKTAQPG